MEESLSMLYLGCFCHLMLIIGLYRYRNRFQKLSAVDKWLFLALYLFISILQYVIFMATLSSNVLSKIIIKENIFSVAQCGLIISSAEIAAIKRGGWHTARHKSYPTTDISAYTINENITLKGTTYKFEEWINATVENEIFSHLATEFDVRPIDLFMKDLFVVKYDINGQRSLPEHRDSSQITFSIALNQIGRDFEGGGTRIVLTDDVINVAQGGMQLHDSGLYHAGHPITAGTRYIMVGFVNVRTTYDNWWRSFGALARCVCVRDPSTPDRPTHAFPPVTVTQLSPHTDIRHDAMCRSWLWKLAYFLKKGAKDSFVAVFGGAYGDGMNTAHDKPIGYNEESPTVTSILVLVVLGALSILLVVILFAFLSLCVCGDDFNAYYCYYVIIMLAPLERYIDPELAANSAMNRQSKYSSRESGNTIRDVENCSFGDGHVITAAVDVPTMWSTGARGRYKDS